MAKMDEMDAKSQSQNIVLREAMGVPTGEEVLPDDLIEDNDDIISDEPISLDEAASEDEWLIEEETESISETFFTDVDIASLEYYDEQYFPVPAHQVIFVGDSRTVGAGRSYEEGEDACLFIGESGEGYDWFTEKGIELLEDAVAAYPDAPVIYNLGVNDCDAVDAYIEVYRDLEKAHPGTDFYYMSVNPVTEESEHVPDSDVQAFNRKLQTAFPERYIDTYTWMTTYGFVSVDGVHYSEEQYRAIHDYAVRAIFSLPQPTVGLEAVTEEETLLQEG